MRYNSGLARGDTVLAEFRLHGGSRGQALRCGGGKNPGHTSRGRLPDFRAGHGDARPCSGGAAEHWKVAPHEQIVLMPEPSSPAGGRG